MDTKDFLKLIEILGLSPLQGEGGFFRETYRSPILFDKDGRSISTAIYYAYTKEQFSALHRLRSDEIYHFYLGDPVEILLLYPDGTGETKLLGHNIEKGEMPQIIVPANTFQGSRLCLGGRFALVGTTMSPGFDFRDFELGDRDTLLKRYPRFATLIKSLTK